MLFSELLSIYSIKYKFPNCYHRLKGIIDITVAMKPQKTNYVHTYSNYWNIICYLKSWVSQGALFFLLFVWSVGFWFKKKKKL